MSNSDLIYRYLKGEMNAQERSAFEKEIENNPELADDVNLHREIDDTLKETDILNFHEQLDTVYKKLNEEGAFSTEYEKDKKQNRTFYMRWYNIAAAVVILLGISTVLYFVLRPPLNERLYSQFFKPYDGSYIVRSSDTKATKYSQAMDLYNAADYEKSWVMFNELIKVDSLKISAMFFKGISAMEINNYTDAVSSFKYIIKDNTTLFVKQAEWYLALCYLKNKDIPNAFKLFGKIAEGNAYHKSDAKKILEKLSDQRQAN